MTMNDATASTHDTIYVYLRDCSVPLFVGIYDHEKPKPQPVIVHVEVIAPLTQRYDDVAASNVALVINYEQLYDFVTLVLPGLGHVPLLESVAESIITFCFKDPRINEVRVRLEKPEAFRGQTLAGIDMRRRRVVT